MEVVAVIKRIEETKVVGTNGFEVRELVVVTEEQHSQTLSIQFTQGRVILLDGFAVGQKVKVHVNLKGNEVIKDNKATVWNKIDGWKIEKLA
jgi:single-strand DNA-binding protein